MLQMKDVSKVYRTAMVETHALRDLSLEVREGEFVAYGINLWLMGKYSVARLPVEFLPIGAGLLWLLGQIAVLGPALRASLIPPAIATRTV